MGELVHVGAHRASLREGSERGLVREYLVIVLGDDLYGVELTEIREILGPPPLTRVPRAPRNVLGVCSVRGQLVTVVDLRARLRVAPPSQARRPRILLTDRDKETLGFLVDEVQHGVRLAEPEVEPAETALGGEVSEGISGIGRPQGQMIILLALSNISVG